MNPQHLALVLAHAADHLRGVPCPALSPAEMAARWNVIAQVMAESQKQPEKSPE